MDLNTLFSSRGASPKKDAIPLKEFLRLYKSERSMQLNPAGRIRESIGAPEIIDTADPKTDARLRIIFSGRTVKLYRKAFPDFFGLEEEIAKIVSYLDDAAKGGVQSRRILMLRGGVGSGKSKLAEAIKYHSRQGVVYVLGYNDGGTIEWSPVGENPLGLFNAHEHGARLEDAYEIPRWRLDAPASMWAHAKLQKSGNFDNFVVRAVEPAVAMVDPGNEAMADTGILIGYDSDERSLETYRYSGALNRTTQGVLDFPDIFKTEMMSNRTALMRPFLDASSGRKYAGQGASGELPYQGIILAHTNLPEWDTFCSLSASKAYRDRMCEIMIPYCVRRTEERDLLRQHLRDGDLANIAIAPGALELLAEFAVRTRITKETELIPREEKIRVYNGEVYLDATLSEKKNVTADDVREHAGYDDGLGGVSERFNQVVLSETAYSDPAEKGIDSVSLVEVLKRNIAVMKRDSEEGGEEEWEEAERVLDEEVILKLNEQVRSEIRDARVEKKESLVQAKIERYALLADAYFESSPVFDGLGERELTRDEIDKELLVVEKGIGARNVKDLRFEVQKALLRLRATGDETTPVSTVLRPELREDFTRFFVEHEPTMPSTVKRDGKDKKAEAKVIKPDVTEFVPRDDPKEQRAHEEFMDRIKTRGYTDRQARRLVQYYHKITTR